MTKGSFLLIVTRDGQHRTHAFDQDVVTIGRSSDNDLALPDRLVSRTHCRIERSNGSFLLVDAGAQNPARLRGRPVARAELRPGETFAIGAFQLQLTLPVSDNQSVDDTRPGEGARGAEDLTTLMSVARALNEEQDLSRLLTQIVDAAIQLASAERGFMILGGGEETSVEVARNFAQEEVLAPEDKVSRTIARRVFESGVPELTTNAQEDDRFRDLASVADLRLRSVLCIPIRIRGVVGGVLYVDNRLQQQVFQEREKALLLALADHAGVAIHNARTMETLKAKQQELQAALDRVDQLNAALRGQLQEKTAELSQIREELSVQSLGRSKYDYKQIVGTGRAMRSVFALLDKYIDADDPVMISGESGTGKELVARAIHSQGARKDQAFVSENCAALPESLLESELFGYTKGSFTGATANKKGLLEAAHRGSLFLDEVGDMPLDLQKKLLRVLQEGEVRPIGSQETLKVDVRLITATNRNLEELVREGDFREDLYYRISVLPVHLPPLRERREDVPHLVRRFLSDIARESSARVRISPDAMERLVRYDWPGNVRELQNEVRRASILCDGIILESHLSQHVREGRSPTALLPGDDGRVPAERGTTLPDLVQVLESREIGRAMQKASGNKSRAAEMLGLSRFALQRKLEKYGLEPGAPGAAPAQPDDGAP
jgi:transcriptional regulator with GAF, ATPase, and Fis domain